MDPRLASLTEPFVTISNPIDATAFCRIGQACPKGWMLDSEVANRLGVLVFIASRATCDKARILLDVQPEAPKTRADLLEELRARVKQAGSQKALATEWGLSPQYINDLLKERRLLPEPIAHLMGYRELVTYHPLKEGK